MPTRNEDAVRELEGRLAAIDALFGGETLRGLARELRDAGVEILKEESDADTGTRPYSHESRWRLSGKAFPGSGPRGGDTVFDECWKGEVEPEQIRFTNRNPVTLFLDQGTTEHGPGPGKKWLFIPLKKEVAVAYMDGERLQGLKFGEDFVLAKHVKGIEGHHFIDKARERIVSYAREMARVFIEEAKAALSGRHGGGRRKR